MLLQTSRNTEWAQCPHSNQEWGDQGQCTTWTLKCNQELWTDKTALRTVAQQLITHRSITGHFDRGTNHQLTPFERAAPLTLAGRFEPPLMLDTWQTAQLIQHWGPNPMKQGESPRPLPSPDLPKPSPHGVTMAKWPSDVLLSHTTYQAMRVMAYGWV